MKVLGMISGTSHDGIDVAVVDFRAAGDGGLDGRLLYGDCVAYDPALRARLLAALPPAPTTMAEVCALDTLIGQGFAAAGAGATAAVGGVDAACSHGQTVFHWVEGVHALGTLQLGSPAWIAERLGCPVVFDVRTRDLTVGGHGAPLACLIDSLLLGDRPGVSAALNLGGISNMTVVEAGHARAFDIGPSNALLDAVVVEHRLHPSGYDKDARIASSGVVDQGLLAALWADPFYALEPPKSTGKEHFHLPYLASQLDRLDHTVALPDLMATLVELTAVTVADAVRSAGATYVAVSGGGSHNPLLMKRLRAALPGVEVVPSDTLGAPADTKEAILMALIGWCTLHGVPGVAPGATGAAQPRILGSITPGTGPLSLPEPVSGITHLRLTGGAP